MIIPFVKRPPTMDLLRERATDGVTTWLTQFAPGLVPERTGPDTDDPSALWMHRFARDVITTNPVSRSPLSPVQIYLIELALECVDWPTLARDRRLRHRDWSRASLVFPRVYHGRARARGGDPVGPPAERRREGGDGPGGRDGPARRPRPGGGGGSGAGGTAGRTGKGGRR